MKMVQEDKGLQSSDQIQKQGDTFRPHLEQGRSRTIVDGWSMMGGEEGKPVSIDNHFQEREAGRED